MFKRMIVALSIVSIITMGAAPAKAGLLDWLTNAGNSTVNWIHQARNNAINAAKFDPNSAAAKSYSWAYDTGKAAGNWLTDNTLSNTTFFSPLFGKITGCPTIIQDSGQLTSIKYYYGSLSNLCNQSGGEQVYQLPLVTGSNTNLYNYVKLNGSLSASFLNGSVFNGLSSVSVAGIPIDANALKNVFNASSVVDQALIDAITALGGTGLPYQPNRVRYLVKPAFNANLQCLASRPAGTNVVQWGARCDAELLGNLLDIKVKFLARFDPRWMSAVFIAVREGSGQGQKARNFAVGGSAVPAVPPTEVGLALFRQAADVDGDGQDEFCRQVGTSIVCSSYDRATGAFTEKSRIGGDLGYTHSRWLADANGNGKADYCREVGDKAHGFSIGCTSFPTPGSTSTTYHIYGDMGYEGQRWFADVNGDGQDEFCRAVGSTSPTSILCTKKSVYFARLYPGDFGYKGQRWFADVDGNGTDDYCREVGNRGKGSNASSIGCTTIQTNGATSTFAGYSTYRISGDLGYLDSRWFADVNHDGKADYCRKAGTHYNSSDTIISCDQLQGSGVIQKRLLTIGHSDIGFYHPRIFADFTGDGRMDYLRTVGPASARRVAVLELNPNHPPVADAGTAQTVESTGSVTTVTLNGSASSDPAGDPLTYNWVWAGGSATGVSPTVNLANGTHSIRLKVDDGKGGTATATTSVAVQDTIAPTVSIAAIPASEATSASGAVVDVAPYVTTADVCGVSLNISPVGTFALGVTTVSVTATDCANNSTSATTTVMVRDTTAPVITPPADITTEATAVQTPVVIGTATATDIFAVSVTSDAPATFPVGTTVVTWTARDANGNTSTATQNVTVVDSTPPSIIAPADLTLEATGNPNTPFVLTIPAVATDAVGVANITSDAIANFPLGFPYGASTVTWTATDAARNSSTATQTITVVDTTPPSLNVPANVTVEATGALTAASLGSASGTDLFGPVTFGNDAPASYAVGATTIHWTATDANGNSTIGTQTVTVTDHTPPTVIAPAAITMEANAPLTIVSLGSASASDLVDGVVTATPDQTGPFAPGTYTITWSATDAHSNTGTATQTVTVTDHTAPVITAPANVSIEANAVNSSVAIGTATASDLVDGVVSVSNNAPATFPLGTTVVNWTATDANGNVSTGTQNVTITDTTAPVLTVPAAVNVEANAVNSTVSIGTATATDIFAVTVTSNAPATYPLGTTVVTWTATDANGNVTTGTQSVTVVDTTAPVLTAPAAVNVEANGVLSTVSIGSATATDIFPVTIISDAPATYPLGTTVVTWTATDANGNVTTGTQSVTVVDITAPAVTANLVAVGMEEDEAIFRVTFSATDIADPNPTVTASLNDSSVTNGQIVKLKRDDEMKAEFEHGKLEIKGVNFSLNVSATDASGNKGNAADAFAFAPEHHDGDKKHGKKKKDKDHKDV